MAKQSAFMKQVQAKQSAQLRYVREFTMQWCADAAILAANEVFHRRGEKLVEFMQAFSRIAHEIAQLTTEDAVADRSLEYTKAKTDAMLAPLLGDAFVPWDERYDFIEKERKI